MFQISYCKWKLKKRANLIYFFPTEFKDLFYGWEFFSDLSISNLSLSQMASMKSMREFNKNWIESVLFKMIVSLTNSLRFDGNQQYRITYKESVQQIIITSMLLHRNLQDLNMSSFNHLFTINAIRHFLSNTL